MKLCH